MLKHSTETKEAMLAYLALVLSKNEARAKMQVDRRTVATDGFMLNISAVLLAHARTDS